VEEIIRLLCIWKLSFIILRYLCATTINIIVNKSFRYVIHLSLRHLQAGELLMIVISCWPFGHFVHSAIWYITAVTSPNDCECSFRVVSYRAPYESHVARLAKVQCIHLFQSFHHYLRNSKFCGQLFSGVCHIVCAYCACINADHILGQLYIYWRHCVVECLLEQCLCGP
jgi:hypothetical protein